MTALAVWWLISITAANCVMFPALRYMPNLIFNERENAMKSDHDEAPQTPANLQRRTLLRGALITGCAVGFSFLGGCKPKDATTTSTAPSAVPPASETPPATSNTPPSTSSTTPSTDSSASTGKMSKAQAQYQTQPKGDQQCSNCMHFLAASNTCKLVDGAIDPQAWCIIWTKLPT